MPEESHIVPEAPTASKIITSQDQPEDILGVDKAEQANYKETDVFAWANNLVQFKDELKIELFLINKNYVIYRTNMSKELDKQLEPIFIDQILEYVLEGVDEGLIVRGFEEAEEETKVLQRTRLSQVEKAKEVLNWLKTQEHEIEMFVEEEHDFKRIKGVMARVTHEKIDKTFYVFKVLPGSQIMKGKQGWMIRGGKFMAFDADAAVRISAEPQMLLLDQDLYVFNQAKLKQLFGYDAKEAYIAQQKITEIEANFKLTFDAGVSMQTLVKDKKTLIKKLQKINPYGVKQQALMDHSEELGIDLMEDDAGSIIIMDAKDLTKFVNLLNDDYIESSLTGQRYEIVKKKLLKLDDNSEENLPTKEVI